MDWKIIVAAGVTPIAGLLAVSYLLGPYRGAVNGRSVDPSYRRLTTDARTARLHLAPLADRLPTRLIKKLQQPSLIVTIAVFVRVALTWYVFRSFGRAVCCVNEAGDIAASLVSGQGFSNPWPNVISGPTAHLAPAYPLLLAGIFRLFGVNTLLAGYVAIGLNALAGGITAALIYRLALRYCDRMTAVIAAWAWAFALVPAIVILRPWDTAISGAVACLWLLWMADAPESTGIRHPVALGVLAGLGCLLNPALLAIFVPTWIWLCWTARYSIKPREVRRAVAASVFVTVVLLVPWTLRNYAMFHRWFLIRDNFGLELWIGNHSGVTRLFDFSGFPPKNPTEFARLGELNYYSKLQSEALTFIREHPRQLLRLCLQRVMDYWTTGGQWFYLPLTLAALYGLIMALWRRGRCAAPLMIALVCFPLVFYVTHTWVWYRYPIEPLLFVLAAYTVATGIRRLTRTAA